MKNVKFKSACPVFVSDDFYKTVDFYTDKLGFKYAGQFDRIGGSFATLYKDSIVIMVVERTWEKIQSYQKTCRMDFDAYIFVDIDGRRIAIAYIHDKEEYFTHTNVENLVFHQEKEYQL